MKVRLTEFEQCLARAIARRRYQSNRQDNVPDAKVGDQDHESTDLDGFGGELAFCKAMNLYPDFNIVPGGGDDLADAVLRDNRRVDVKTSRHPEANLVARKVQGDIDLFVLVRGILPDYEIVGYATRAELVAGGKRDLGHGFTHFLHASKLHPIEDLRLMPGQ